MAVVKIQCMIRRFQATRRFLKQRLSLLSTERLRSTGEHFKVIEEVKKLCEKRHFLEAMGGRVSSKNSQLARDIQSLHLEVKTQLQPPLAHPDPSVRFTLAVLQAFANRRDGCIDSISLKVILTSRYLEFRSKGFTSENNTQGVGTQNTFIVGKVLQASLDMLLSHVQDDRDLALRQTIFSSLVKGDIFMHTIQDLKWILKPSRAMLWRFLLRGSLPDRLLLRAVMVRRFTNYVDNQLRETIERTRACPEGSVDMWTHQNAVSKQTGAGLRTVSKPRRACVYCLEAMVLDSQLEDHYGGCTNAPTKQLNGNFVERPITPAAELPGLMSPAVDSDGIVTDESDRDFQSNFEII